MTKSVRTKALSLATAVLELSPQQADEEQVAAARAGALRAWLPEMCLLASPPPGSGLSDEAGSKVRLAHHVNFLGSFFQIISHPSDCISSRSL